MILWWTTTEIKEVKYKNSKERERLVEGLKGNVGVMRELMREWGRECDWMERERNGEQFLAQSYAAATFILALNKNKVMAIPEGMKEEGMKWGRYNLEWVYMMKPKGVFVSYYSDPNVLDCLRKMGIKLFYLENPTCIDDILKGLKMVGDVIGEREKAEWMCKFVETAMRELDKKVKLKKFVVAFNNNIPTKKTLTGQLMLRMGVNKEIIESEAWSIPLTKEFLIKHGIEKVIVMGEDIDMDVQLSPTQFIVLAYYDIIEAL